MNERSGVFAPLAGTDYECAIRAIVNSGREPAEFVLEERCTDIQLPGGTTRSYKLVSVKRLTAGLQRQYNTGRGRHKTKGRYHRPLTTE